jgi:tetratricopeptide (TPR) repeat protein
MLFIMSTLRTTLALLTFSFFSSLLPSQASATDRWVETRSAHFTVSSNADEKEARRIANQFEEIRSVFLVAFPALRVDPGKPTAVLAVKDENSLRVLLPDYAVPKDRGRTTGIFLPSLERNFAVLRTDAMASNENPYHTLYFEYTLNVLRLNFPALPTWLSVGLAEFYANTIVESGEIGVGRASKWQLDLLKRSQLIPVQTLMNVDQRSPIYNEHDRASLFYAESWLLVHYLMNDPGAAKNQLLFHFLHALEDKRDSEEAAKATFGDLKHFQLMLEEYARQSTFHYQRLKPNAPVSEQAYPIHELSQPEVLALQADFLAHSGHDKEAKEMFRQAIQESPDFAAAHTGAGYVAYLQHDNETAMNEFDKAVSLDSQDFRPYHFRALLFLRTRGYAKESTPQIIGNLEKVISLNPDFAPAFGFLSVAYRQQDDTKPKSFDVAVRAAKLEPANFMFIADIGDSLLALNRDQEANKVLERMRNDARTAGEKTIVESFGKRVAGHQEAEAKKNAPSSANAPSTSATPPPDSSNR